MNVNRASLTLPVSSPVRHREPVFSGVQLTSGSDSVTFTNAKSVRFGNTEEVKPFGLKNPEVTKAIQTNDGAALLDLDSKGLVFGPDDNHSDELLRYVVAQQGYLDQTAHESKVSFQIPKMFAFDSYGYLYLKEKSDGIEALQKKLKPDMKQDVLIAFAMMYAKRDCSHQFKTYLPAEKYVRSNKWPYRDELVATSRHYDFDLRAIHDIDPENFYKKIVEFAPKAPGSLVHMTARVLPDSPLHMAVQDRMPESVFKSLIAAEPKLLYGTYSAEVRPLMQYSLINRNVPAFQFFYEQAFQDKDRKEVDKMLAKTDYEDGSRYTAQKPILNHLMRGDYPGDATPETLAAIKALLDVEPGLILTPDPKDKTGKKQIISPQLIDDAQHGDHFHSRRIGGSDMMIFMSKDKPENRPPFYGRQALIVYAAKRLGIDLSEYAAKKPA